MPESPEIVKQILTSVSLQPVSFELKRQDGTYGVFINAYLGVCGGYEFGSNQGYYGIAAPIGIEFVKGLSCGWSIGLFIPMIDIGKAISAQIYKEQTPSVADVVAPGIGGTVGIPELPILLHCFIHMEWVLNPRHQV